jgi:hypothetical protein
MDSLVLMGESLCRVDSEVSLHLTVPEAPASVRSWAQGRPEVFLSTTPPDGVSGWDVKPWLLLRELNAGWPDALWLDADIIVTRSVSGLLKEFPQDCLMVAEEWNRPEANQVATRSWGLPSARPVRPINSCFVRVNQAHRPLLERWLQMTHDPRYREAQSRDFQHRPWHLASDQVLLTALLGSAEFGHVPFTELRLGRDIAQCAGSSGYLPRHRILDLFRGLPPLIHCIGRKPWMSEHDRGRVHRFLTDLASDVSPYVLASHKIARELDAPARWVEARTPLGAMLRRLTGHHPGMAGLPLAILHAFHVWIGRSIGLSKRMGR